MLNLLTLESMGQDVSLNQYRAQLLRLDLVPESFAARASR
jgi:hypothetical protein